MSKSSEHAITPQPQKINKLELASDVIAFLSIISAYQFLSITLHYNVFESFLGLTLDNINEIAWIYLFYSLLIIVLKSVAWLLSLKKGEIEVVGEINAAVNRSLFTVFFIITVYIFTVTPEATIGVAALSQITAWLFVAELNLIFCSLLKKFPIFQSVSLFGVTIEVILVLGQLARFLPFDFFEIL